MRWCLQLRLPAASLAGACLGARTSFSKEEAEARFSGLPARLQHQLSAPQAPYPLWDTDWDNRKLDAQQRLRAASVQHQNGAAARDDVVAAIRSLFAVDGPGARDDDAVDALLLQHGDDLDPLLAKALFAARGVYRHVILVRHGQYDEDGAGDEAKSLTELGRRQALRTGEKLKDLLEEPLAAGKTRVRLHVSTMTRAKETAGLVASRWPSESFDRLDASPLLVEGSPPVHNVPAPLYTAGQVHASLMEAAFRRYFRRPALAALAEPPHGEVVPRHEYDVIVCHANVIRFFALRALQLPPEAWFRFHPKNCSITHLRISPEGHVDLFSFGDAGHLDAEHTTFGMHARYPFK